MMLTPEPTTRAGRAPRGLEDFERLKLLGKGSFGQAWTVQHRHTGEIFVAKAIKCFNRQDLEDALNEAHVLSKVKHPFIVGYHDVIKSSAKLVTILMEFCSGGDLSERIARRKYRHEFFDEALLRTWFVQATDAVAYLHKRGILHRDIKTGNLFITTNDVVKLGDFGISRILPHNAVAPAERTTRTPVGTPMNMSPEICRGEIYGQKADIWALGCVLYEMLSLRPAFMAYDMQSLVRKIKHGHHDQHIPKRYSLDFPALVSDMLLVDASQRPTASEILKRTFLREAHREARALAKSLVRATNVPPSAMAPPAEPSRPASPDILVLDDVGAEDAASTSPVNTTKALAAPAPEVTPHVDHLGRRQQASPGASPRLPRKSAPNLPTAHVLDSLLNDAGPQIPARLEGQQDRRRSRLSDRQYSDPGAAPHHVPLGGSPPAKVVHPLPITPTAARRPATKPRSFSDPAAMEDRRQRPHLQWASPQMRALGAAGMLGGGLSPRSSPLIPRRNSPAWGGQLRPNNGGEVGEGLSPRIGRKPFTPRSEQPARLHNWLGTRDQRYERR